VPAGAEGRIRENAQSVQRSGGEEEDVEGVLEEIPDRLDPATVDIHDVADRLEGVERDPQRQDDVEVGRSRGKPKSEADSLKEAKKKLTYLK